MPVKVAGDDPIHRCTMEEICKDSDFDPQSMSEVDHLEELCMVGEYLASTLRHYTGRIMSDLPLSTSKENDDPQRIS